MNKWIYQLWQGEELKWKHKEVKSDYQDKRSVYKMKIVSLKINDRHNES